VIVRRGPAIVLSLVLSAAAFAAAPSATADDVGTAKDVDPCSMAAKVKLRASYRDNGRIEVIGTVWSNDGDVWDWRFKHNGDVSFEGAVEAEGDEEKSFRIERTMVPSAPDTISFRAVNRSNEQVCRAEINFAG
jgi:hypothetical protein